jgi:hypothetical protein
VAVCGARSWRLCVRPSDWYDGVRVENASFGTCDASACADLHYVRSFGWNVGVSFMVNMGSVMDDAHCPSESELPWLSLAEFDFLWTFPGMPGEPEYNRVKMGLPNWKQYIEELQCVFRD